MLLKKIWIAFQADLVGIDAYGNKYYESRYKRHDTKRKRRWGIFAKGTDSRSIPPEWHLWLHHTSKATPKQPFFRGGVMAEATNDSGKKQAYWPKPPYKPKLHTWEPSSVRPKGTKRKTSGTEKVE